MVRVCHYCHRKISEVVTIEDLFSFSIINEKKICSRCCMATKLQEDIEEYLVHFDVALAQKIGLILYDIKLKKFKKTLFLTRCAMQKEMCLFDEAAEILHGASVSGYSLVPCQIMRLPLVDDTIDYGKYNRIIVLTIHGLLVEELDKLKEAILTTSKRKITLHIVTLTQFSYDTFVNLV